MIGRRVPAERAERSGPLAIEELCLESKVVYEGKLLKVARTGFICRAAARGSARWCRHPGAVAMVPITEDGLVVLVEQWRYAAGGPPLRSAGTLEPGEEPAACAARELAEEIGCRAGRLSCLLFALLRPAARPSGFTLFLARDLEPAEAEGRMLRRRLKRSGPLADAV